MSGAETVSPIPTVDRRSQLGTNTTVTFAPGTDLVSEPGDGIPSSDGDPELDCRGAALLCESTQAHGDTDAA
jgi:hypothetical protein